MQAHTIETHPHAVHGMDASAVARRISIPQVRWGAVIAGTVVGFASYLLLSLFGVAVGLTALDPQSSADAAGTVGMVTGIWTGISLLIAAFIGGYVASRMSGLGRRADGVLHGFVVWGAITVLLAWLMTTAIGNLLGGAFNVLGQGIQAASDQPGVTQQLGQAIQEGGAALQQQDGQQIAETAVGSLTVASWWLFVGLVLSLAMAIWGGAIGSRSVTNRTIEDHSDERRSMHV